MITIKDGPTLIILLIQSMKKVEPPNNSRGFGFIRLSLSNYLDLFQFNFFKE